MKRLLLLDGHSLAYRAFFALPVENFSTTTGQATNAVYGFVSMLINTLRDEKPTHVAVTFDLSRQTFRSAEYPEYKAGRAATPDEFRPQIGLIREVLEAAVVKRLRSDVPLGALLSGVVVLVSALTFFPALALGPLAEALL